MSTRALRWTSFFVFLGIVSTLTIWSWQNSNPHEHQNERYAVKSLRDFVIPALAEFRNTDPLGKGKKGYWRADVAGLYFLKRVDGKPLRLIPQSVALADDRPATKYEDGIVPSPGSGYWYRGLPRAGETAPHPDRFAICAYPDSAMAGKWIYLITEKNVLYRKEAAGAMKPDVCPDEPDKDGWERRSDSDRY